MGIATHSSILAWRIPWTEKPGDLQSRRGRGGIPGCRPGAGWAGPRGALTPLQPQRLHQRSHVRAAAARHPPAGRRRGGRGFARPRPGDERSLRKRGPARARACPPASGPVSLPFPQTPHGCWVSDPSYCSFCLSAPPSISSVCPARLTCLSPFYPFFLHSLWKD